MVRGKIKKKNKLKKNQLKTNQLLIPYGKSKINQLLKKKLYVLMS